MAPSNTSSADIFLKKKDEKEDEGRKEDDTKKKIDHDAKSLVSFFCTATSARSAAS